MTRISFTVPGEVVGINDAHVGGARPFVKSPAAREFAERVAGFGYQARIAAGQGTWIDPVRVRIVIYAANRRRDVDAGVKAILDSLQAPAMNPFRPGAGIIRNDRQVTTYTVERIIDDEPRIEVEVELLETDAEARERVKAALRSALRPAKREKINAGRLRPSVRRYGP